MNDKDYIKELFSEKLRNHELPVKPQLWDAVAAKVGSHAAGSVGAGVSAFTKGVIAIAVGVAATVISIVVFKQSESIDNPTKKPVQKVVSNTPGSEELNTAQTRENEFTQESPKISDITAQEEVQFVSQQNTPEPVETERKITAPEKEREETIERIQQVIEREVVAKEDEPLDKIIPEKEEQNTQLSPDKSTKDVEIILPNVFSPNGDRQNDVLLIDYKGQLINDFSVVILDQRNNVVYQSNNPDFNWDGLDRKGEPVPVGEYVYYITGVSESGHPINKYSRLSVRR